MKKIYVNTILTAIAVFLVFTVLHEFSLKKNVTEQSLTVGFVYVGDESTSYTNNFIGAQKQLESHYKDKIKTIVKSNVSEEEAEEPIRELAEAGCDIIFTTSYGYSDTVKRIAGEYPKVQFCQASGANANDAPVYENYHTFMGEIYQGRYIAGVVAGMKLKELIEEGEITAREAQIGYVAAYPYPEVISGYTAFLLGARSVVPETTMNVRYVNTWSSYTLEKNCAKALIEEGCIIISQHSDTAGPAVACEETNRFQNVYHVGYNLSMIDMAPTTSLISTRINWSPYVTGAVQAVFEHKTIESYVDGNVHGNDIGAGFEQNWVEMLDLNQLIAAKGTQETIEEYIQNFTDEKCNVFVGDYIGVNPSDPSDTYDLKDGYMENADSSAPSFNYVLKDIITVE